MSEAQIRNDSALVPKTAPWAAGVSVRHVASRCRVYPSEPVTFYTRVEVFYPFTALEISLSLSPGVTLENCAVQPAGIISETPLIENRGGALFLFWSCPHGIQPGATIEFETQTRTLPSEVDRSICSQVLLQAPGFGTLAEGTVNVLVQANANYLRHLPELYAADSLMNRFLMFFESFWSPIHTQINQIHYTFDPGLCPEEFLPWLSSWVGAEIDLRLPEDRKRLLATRMLSIYRRRGTRAALIEFLEIYTGGKAEITEYSSSNFVLGPSATLGYEIALGIQNQPHTFSVRLHLPPEASIHSWANPNTLQRDIEAIIESLKPAHTQFSLVIEKI